MPGYSCGRENADAHLVRAHTRACMHAHKHVTSPSLFTRIPFSIDPLCTRSGSSVVRSWLPALLGLFIRLPMAATLFKAPQDSCPSTAFSYFGPVCSPFSLCLFSLSLSLIFYALPLAPSIFLGSLLRLFRWSIDGNPTPDNKGDCMYYLACLSHAYPAVSRSTFESCH